MILYVKTQGSKKIPCSTPSTLQERLESSVYVVSALHPPTVENVCRWVYIEEKAGGHIYLHTYAQYTHALPSNKWRDASQPSRRTQASNITQRSPNAHIDYTRGDIQEICLPKSEEMQFNVSRRPQACIILQSPNAHIDYIRGDIQVIWSSRRPSRVCVLWRHPVRASEHTFCNTHHANERQNIGFHHQSRAEPKVKTSIRFWIASSYWKLSKAHTDSYNWRSLMLPSSGFDTAVVPQWRLVRWPWLVNEGRWESGIRCQWLDLQRTAMA